jgi:hypothetical protein
MIDGTPKCECGKEADYLVTFGKGEKQYVCDETANYIRQFKFKSVKFEKLASVDIEVI